MSVRHQATAGEFLDNFCATFLQRVGQNHHRIQTGKFRINRFADRVRRRFQFQTRRAAAGETDRAEPFVGGHFQTVFRRDVVNHLHRRGRQTGFAHGGERFFREQPRRVRMIRMRLGDDGISCRDRRRKIAAGNSVVGKGKIIRPKNQNRSERRERGTDI